jgi:membrane-associated protease RseP (regulator of RpoE activity)
MLYKCLPLVLATVLSAGTPRNVFAEDSNRDEIKRELSEVRETLSKALEQLHRLEEKLVEGNTGAEFDNMADEDFAWLRFGLRLEDVEEQVSETTNMGRSHLRGTVRIVEVRPKSSAAAAGMRKNDLLLGLNGFSVTNATDIRGISLKEPASNEAKNKFVIIRNGQAMYGVVSGF